MTNVAPPQRRRPRAGFTLVELLVVITIILIVSIASIPVVMPALNERRVSSGALLLQAELTRARDTAIRANAPRGVRLLPDRTAGGALAFVPLRFPPPVNAAADYAEFLRSAPGYTRLIAIEPGPDHTEGQVRSFNAGLDLGQMGGLSALDVALWRTVWESKVTSNVTPFLPRSPTSWYWNVRRGDRIRLAGSGRSWIIVGPMLVPNGPGNPEAYVNWGAPGAFTSLPGLPATSKEFLIVLDGEDNDADGFVDEQFDGLDNNDDGVIDPGFNGRDDNGNNIIDEPAELFYVAVVGLPPEMEPEAVPDLEPTDGEAIGYTIDRQPVPSIGARELALPAGAAIDLTTWMAGGTAGMPGVPERSRLPIDPYSGYIDVMVAPNGQIVLPSAGRAVTPPPSQPYYHFWVSDIEDIVPPDPAMLDATTRVPHATYLPLPEGTSGYAPADPTRILRGSRRLVSLNTRTGAVTTTSLEAFDVTEFANPATRPPSFLSPIRDLVLGRVYRNAELGLKETP
jgi:prepilin-type N-terminal cleavage/methylation domain-containing protein